MLKKIIAGASVVGLPVLAFGANAAPFGTLQSSIAEISRFIGSLIPLVIGIAVLLFLVGLLRYITAGADEEAKEAARGMIIYGIIVLFVMVSVWGFVKILSSTLFPGQDQADQRAPYVPTVPVPPQP